MPKMRSFTVMAVAVLAVAGLAWGQSVDEQFATYHDQLRGTADDILRAPAGRIELDEGRDAATLPDNDPQTFTAALGRVQQLRPLLEPILREQGVPTDLAAVVLVESGGRATALSPKGALGLWQLMPETARRYGLAVSPGRDERLDPEKGTRAAVRYLRDLYDQFGDWRLALAAYNAGEQAVQRAMARSGSNDFQRLLPFLPNETRAYVPAIMTARPLFTGGRGSDQASLLAARRARVLYASARLDN